MQLILIGGAQRSGTTLLQTLLANALDAPVLPEAHILYGIMATYQRAKQFGHKTRFFYPTDGELLSFFRAFAQRHVADVVASVGGGASALVLKDPSFVLVLDEASALFPQSINIVCLRDPRDIAASFVQIGERELTESKTGKYGKRDIRFISKKILSSYSPLLKPAETVNAVLVRYEDVASDPRRALQVLARETGLQLSFDHLENPVWLAADARHETSWITQLEGQKPSPESVGSFTRVLHPDEIGLVQQICQPIMERFGYAPIKQQSPGYVDRLLGRFRAEKARAPER